MKIQTIKVKNFRLLKEFKIDLEDNISLVIGKNNTGKTSTLSVIEKFLTDKSDFSINDFNLDELKVLTALEKSNSIVIPEDFDFKIQLLFEIKYEKEDSLRNIASLILNLDDNNIVVLGFEYFLNPKTYSILINEYRTYKLEKKKKNIVDFLSLQTSKRFFKTEIKSFEYKKDGDLSNFQIIKDKALIPKIINFQSIKAKREVNNSDTNRPDKTLSKLSSDYYESIENTQLEVETIKKLKKELESTDDSLNQIYPLVFKDIIKKVELFGGNKQGESIIGILSSLESKNILKENTSVYYKHSHHQLPEDYHGLGYMNLFAMIFDIELKCRSFRKENEAIENQIPSDINLLFIEEPEAHTHPQMQHIFIKNVTKILDNEMKGYDAEGKKVEGKLPFKLQGIVTTHSSHITVESNFDCIKYFYKKTGENKVVSKNLKDLIKSYSVETKEYEFLKHYLTLNRAELFFADKAILIEGDTERMLLPVMMSKLDTNNSSNVSLLSQNISIIEVGAYSHIFEKFIDFIGIKYLIITDIDPYRHVGTTNKKGKPLTKRNACRVNCSDIIGTSNESLNHFLTSFKFSELKESEKNFYLKDNTLSIAFQHEENGYHASSFEDAFISQNLEFIKTKLKEFRGLKNRQHFNLIGDEKKDPYDLALKCVSKKTHFALDILFHSDATYSNWEIPSYIKEGLLWLQK